MKPNSSLKSTNVTSTEAHALSRNYPRERHETETDRDRETERQRTIETIVQAERKRHVHTQRKADSDGEIRREACGRATTQIQTTTNDLQGTDRSIENTSDIERNTQSRHRKVDAIMSGTIIEGVRLKMGQRVTTRT
jgi:hypothetical protein